MWLEGNLIGDLRDCSWQKKRTLQQYYQHQRVLLHRLRGKKLLALWMISLVAADEARTVNTNEMELA